MPAKVAKTKVNCFLFGSVAFKMNLWHANTVTNHRFFKGR